MNFNYATSSFTRARGNFPELSVVNMFAETVPSEGEQPSLISRPGIETTDVTMGLGPIQGLFQSDGILGGLLYGVSGGDFYEAGTSVGTIDGDGPVSFAGYDTNLFIANGASLWSYDGTTLSALTFPEDAEVTKVIVGASRAIAIKANSHRFYWTEPLDTVFDDLSFASAEYSPDGLRDGLFWNDALILFGTKTVEFWPVAADATAPFQPMQGRVYQTGIKATGAATLVGSTFAWVTDRDTICVETPENIVSFPGLEAKISTSDSVRLWTFIHEGNEYLTLTLDTETWVLNLRQNGSWTLLSSYGETNFLGNCFAGGVFGSFTNGTCLSFAADYDDLGGPLVRTVSAWLPINDTFFPVNQIQMRANTGTTEFLTGNYVNPKVSIRLSKDGGRSWSPWKERRLGEQGDYTNLPTWNSLGKYTYPGLLAEIQCSDPVSFRLSGLTINGDQ